MKRLFTLLTLFCWFIASFAYDVEVDGIYYNLNHEAKTATVTSGFPKYSGSITIPASITFSSVFYDVTSIGGSAFRDCKNLTSVTIPNSMTSIGDHAFNGCSGLTYVTIGNSVTSIGESAFYDCSGLTSVTIPNSVTSIGKSAFNGCYRLSKAEFASIESLCTIQFANSESNPLYYVHHLYINGEEVKELIIPNSVTSIGDYAFYRCYDLTSVTIPNSVTSIGDYAFCECM